MKNVLKFWIFIFLPYLILGCSRNVNINSKGVENQKPGRFWTKKDFSEDIYYPIHVSEIDISKTGEFKTDAFSFEHEGFYTAGLYLNEIPEEYKFSAKNYDNFKTTLEVNIFQGNDLVLSQKLNKPLLHFWSKQGNGIMLNSFKVPDELLNKKIISCSIKILVPDKEFSNNYGPVKFFIKKMFEY